MLSNILSHSREAERVTGVILEHLFQQQHGSGCRAFVDTINITQSHCTGNIKKILSTPTALAPPDWLATSGTRLRLREALCNTPIEDVTLFILATGHGIVYAGTGGVQQMR